jgi:hypothetical protein
MGMGAGVRIRGRARGRGVRGAPVVKTSVETGKGMGGRGRRWRCRGLVCLRRRRGGSLGWGFEEGGRALGVCLPLSRSTGARMSCAATIPPPPSIYSSFAPFPHPAYGPPTQDPPIFSTLTGIQLDSECCAHTYVSSSHPSHLIGYFTRSHILISIYSYSYTIEPHPSHFSLFLLPSSVAFPPPRLTSYAPLPPPRLRLRSTRLALPCSHTSHTSMRAAPPLPCSPARLRYKYLTSLHIVQYSTCCFRYLLR